MGKRITIDPITRLEGHGKIEIFLDNSGNVENAYLQIPEMRGFEKFAEGRPAEEMPRITPRICGVCPHAHHMASAKAVDRVFGVEPPPTAVKLREIFYNAHFVHSHVAHFYALAAPDFVCGPSAPPAERNIIGVINKVGLEIGGEVIKNRSYAQRIQQLLGGKRTHSVFALPGGVSKSINEEERKEIEEMAKSIVEFCKLSFKIFNDVVLENKEYVDLILSESFVMPTYYMGLIDNNNRVTYYEGKVRVVDPEGKEVALFDADDYREYICEHVEPWSYLKFPYLKSIGWKGLVYGADSGVYRAAPLARLNVSDGMATPLAQEEFEKMYRTLGGKPSHHTLAMHWARLIEQMQAAEDMLRLCREPDITDPDVRNIPKEVVGKGVGIVEAPRGTLIHDYETDDKGFITKANLIVATINNYPAMCISIREAAKGLIKEGKVNDGLLNMVEMAFRAYDPCIGCATNTLPGQTPLEITVKNKNGEVLDVISRFK
ncbi:MAG: Ni/Fe hydrogenase subunit alpha [Candidatus Eremiobacteraeota bacterium]|nr:Ni/Fe hydrogenase subunit alpha [Candidatus Eremiobacteraeota bacterium]